MKIDRLTQERLEVRDEALEEAAALLEANAKQQRDWKPETYAQNYAAEVLKAQARLIRGLKGEPHA